MSLSKYKLKLQLLEQMMYIMNMYTMHIYSLIYICACVGSVCVCVIRDMAAGRGRHTVRR